jgi:hypothetical protein
MHRPYRGYEKSKHPSFIVRWDLQWKIIDLQRLEAGADLLAAMLAAIERVKTEGWQPESEPSFGCVFIRRAGVRLLMALTPRDPRDDAPQSFSPFR